MAGPGSTAGRGYGSRHQDLRAWWKPYVATGGVDCHAIRCLLPSRQIVPRPGLKGDGWHLGHTPDRLGYTGPEHMECNTSDGARRGNANRAPRQPRTPRPRPQRPRPAIHRW